MEDIITTFHPRHFLQLSVPYIYKYNLEECILCGRQVYFQSDSYYCGTCEFHFHIECATTLMKSCLTIYHPETHEHTLTFLRKKNSFNCDACGMVDERKMNMYACLPCNFFVHRNCIYLPKVIKITRHPQRLFHTLQFYDDGYMNCRVCNEKIVCGYGGYSCIDKICAYKVHSHCATNSNVWDGKDVTGEPEENLVEDVELPLFEEIDGQKIHHFSHHHDLMKLHADYEEESGRLCQACILPIDFDSFFGCKQCDFSLHNTCACLPRKMEHALHRHSLILQVDMMGIEERFFTCSICDRESCGFMYRCSREECGFKMDARCGSIAEPFYHVAHQHPLSLVQNFHDNIYFCSFCHLSTRTFAACNLCSNMCMDFKCATLPVSVKCKYDIHPLTLSFSLSSYDSAPWYELSLSSKLHVLPLCCDICEAKIDQTLLFYICYECNTTIHVECLIGKYPYLKPGHEIKVNGVEIQIAYNTLSRPTCHTCHGFCEDKLVFISRRDGVCFCSINCINSSATVVGDLVLIE